MRRTLCLRDFVCALLLMTGLLAAAEIRADQNVIMFNVSPSKSFSILHNGVDAGASNSTGSGVVAFATSATPGDVLSVFEAGTVQPPTSPTGIQVAGDDVGCAVATWSANPEGDVNGYVLYYNETPAVGGGYGHSVEVTGTTTRAVCGLADGTYYFAVRAKNSAGMLSDLSIEVSASVSTGNVQPPLPPQFVTAAEGSPGCLSVSWFASGDPQVVGYTVDYGTSSVQGGAPSYDSSVDVGNVTSCDVCGLATGTYYVAVRARNYQNMLSAYSNEEGVDLSTTPVLVTTFAVEAVGFGVHLEWAIWSDEFVDGFLIYRSIAGRPGTEVLVNDGTMLDAGANSYADYTVEGETDYVYRLVVVSEGGKETTSPAIEVTTNRFDLVLAQNIPNPFNPRTQIAFDLPDRAQVRLEVYDARGALLSTLVDDNLERGRHVVSWDGRDNRGRSMSSGVYFYRIRAGGQTRSRKMVILK